MELIKRFRVDTLKLSTENLPVAEADGTTCYEVDTMKLYIYYKGQWYLQEEVSTEETNQQQNNTKIIEEPIKEKQSKEPIISEEIIEEPIKEKQSKEPIISEEIIEEPIKEKQSKEPIISEEIIEEPKEKIEK